MSFLLFLVIALMVSITINVTLLVTIHSQYVNSIINKGIKITTHSTF